MKIEFYEEFPSIENLKKLKKLKFKTKIFLGADSIEEFRRWEKIAKSYKKNLEAAYWPIVPNSYWFSAFANPKDLKDLFNNLEKIKNPLLIDLELTLFKHWKLYFRNLFNMRKNKRMIKKFLEKNKKRITTAEYIRSPLQRRTKFLGLDFDVGTEKSLMFYTSTFCKKTRARWGKMLSGIKDKNNYSISLGTIAKGIMGNEPILSPERLEKDFEFVKKEGFDKVIIFRLEGITPEYLKVIKKFST